jgi:hypothetical protein
MASHGAYDELLAYLEDYEQLTNRISLTDLRLHSSVSQHNSANSSKIDHYLETQVDSTPHGNISHHHFPVRKASFSKVNGPTIPADVSSTAVLTPSIFSENRSPSLSSELEYFLQQVIKQKQFRLHQLRNLQHSLLTDLEWDFEFNEGVVDTNSLPKDGLTDEEYQTILFGGSIAQEDNLDNTISDSKQISKRNSEAALWDEFDEQRDVNTSYLHSKSKLRSLAYSISDILGQAANQAKAHQVAFDTKKLDFNQNSHIEKRHYQSQKHSSSDYGRDSYESMGVGGSAEVASLQHGIPAQNSSIHVAANTTASFTSLPSPYSSTCKSSSPISSQPRSEDMTRISLISMRDGMQHTRAPSESSSSPAPNSFPKSHSTGTRLERQSPRKNQRSPSSFSIRTSVASSWSELNNQPKTNQQNHSIESKIASIEEDDQADDHSVNSRHSFYSIHNQDMVYLDPVSSRSAQPSLPPTGLRRKSSTAHSFHEYTDTVSTQNVQSSIISKTRIRTETKQKDVKEDDGQLSSGEGTVDHEQSSLGISAIERRDSGSDHETAVPFMLPRQSKPLVPESKSAISNIVSMEGKSDAHIAQGPLSSVVHTQSHSPPPHKNEFDPIDSFLSTNRSRSQSRTQSFDFHHPVVTSISPEREGQIDLFLLASQDLDVLLSAPTEEEEAEFRKQDELIAALESSMLPKTPVGKPPFSPC